MTPGRLWRALRKMLAREMLGGVGGGFGGGRGGGRGEAVDDFEDLGAVAGGFGFADAGDVEEIVRGGGEEGAEGVQGSVVQDDEGGDGLLFGGGAAPFAEFVAKFLAKFFAKVMAERVAICAGEFGSSAGTWRGRRLPGSSGVTRLGGDGCRGLGLRIAFCGAPPGAWWERGLALGKLFDGARRAAGSGAGDVKDLGQVFELVFETIFGPAPRNGTRRCGAPGGF